MSSEVTEVDVYRRLAKVLDTLPNGFPSTDSGVELAILKKVFTPRDADLFCRLRLTFETAEQISARTGRTAGELETRLVRMARRGQIFMIQLGDTRFFRMLPWVFGIYEFQLGRLDRELVELCEEYAPVYSKAFHEAGPPLMKTIAVEEAIPSDQQALPFERVSALIEQNQSFLLNECICRKERAIMGHPCDRPLESCLSMAPVPDVFEDSETGRVLSREEAHGFLKRAEEAGLVHLTGNMQYGHIYICNCCKCCCGVLRAINEFHLPAASVVNSRYCAEIDPLACTGCGICADERCQVGAIRETGEVYEIAAEKCIGCGLCISTCPAEAVRLKEKPADQVETPPLTETDWFKAKGKARGVDFSEFE